MLCVMFSNNEGWIDTSSIAPSIIFEPDFDESNEGDSETSSMNQQTKLVIAFAMALCFSVFCYRMIWLTSQASDPSQPGSSVSTVRLHLANTATATTGTTIASTTTTTLATTTTTAVVATLAIPSTTSTLDTLPRAHVIASDSLTVDQRQPSAIIQIKFGCETSPRGYFPDFGQSFDHRSADSNNLPWVQKRAQWLLYGWNIPHQNHTRCQSDQSLVSMFDRESTWYIMLPNGTYSLSISIGDPVRDTVSSIMVQNQPFIIQERVLAGAF
jgi:hypothetical protein